MSHLEEIEGYYTETMADEVITEEEERREKIKFICNKIELISDPWTKMVLKEILELMT